MEKKKVKASDIVRTGDKQIHDKMYNDYVKRVTPVNNRFVNMLNAFWIGGLICTLGQGLLTIYKSWGLDKEQAGTATSVTLIFITAVLTGLGVFDDLAKRAGAGTLVPITGFANAVVSPAVEFKTEGFILGVGAKMFTIAGPVIVYGLSASVVYGLIYWLWTIL